MVTSPNNYLSPAQFDDGDEDDDLIDTNHQATESESHKRHTNHGPISEDSLGVHKTRPTSHTETLMKYVVPGGHTSNNGSSSSSSSRSPTNSFVDWATSERSSNSQSDASRSIPKRDVPRQTQFTHKKSVHFQDDVSRDTKTKTQSVSRTDQASSLPVNRTKNNLKPLPAPPSNMATLHATPRSISLVGRHSDAAMDVNLEAERRDSFVSRDVRTNPIGQDQLWNAYRSVEGDEGSSSSSESDSSGGSSGSVSSGESTDSGGEANNRRIRKRARSQNNSNLPAFKRKVLKGAAAEDIHLSSAAGRSSSSTSSSRSDTVIADEDMPVISDLMLKGLVPDLGAKLDRYLPGAPEARNKVIAGVASLLLTSAEGNNEDVKNKAEGSAFNRAFAGHTTIPTVVTDTWNACVSPMFEELLKIGFPSPPAMCWACRHVNNEVASSIKSWQEMEDIFLQDFSEADPVPLAIRLKKHFDKHIRIPANKTVGPGMKTIPDWKAVDIFMHFYEHKRGPINDHIIVLNQLNIIKNAIFANGLWESNELLPFMARPSSEGLDNFLKVIKALKEYHRAEPTKCFLSNGISHLRGRGNYKPQAAAFYINPHKPYHGGDLKHPAIMGSASH